MRIHASINRMVNKEDSAIKAYASVTMDGMFAVHGLRVIETERADLSICPPPHTPIRTATSSTATPSTP